MKTNLSKFKLRFDGSSGDNKRAFAIGNDDNFRMEVDTDDCDAKEAMRVLKHIIKVVNNADVPQPWECSECHRTNPKDATTCEACDCPKGK